MCRQKVKHRKCFGWFRGARMPTSNRPRHPREEARGKEPGIGLSANMHEGSGCRVGCGECRRRVKRGIDGKNHCATKTIVDTECLFGQVGVHVIDFMYRFAVSCAGASYIAAAPIARTFPGPAQHTKAQPAKLWRFVDSSAVLAGFAPVGSPIGPILPVVLSASPASCHAGRAAVERAGSFNSSCVKWRS